MEKPLYKEKNKYQTQIIKLTIEAMVDKVQIALLLRITTIIMW